MKASIQDIYITHHKKIRFLMVGVLNTIVGLSVYPILYLLMFPVGFGYIEILMVAQFLCITFSFISNKYFVFKTQGNFKKEYLKFFAFHGVYFLINLIALPVLVEVFEVNPIVAQTSYSLLIIVTSYFWHNAITFKEVKE